MQISILGSFAAVPFGAFSFWHIPGQRGKESVSRGQLSVVSRQWSVVSRMTGLGCALPLRSFGRAAQKSEPLAFPGDSRGNLVARASRPLGRERPAPARRNPSPPLAKEVPLWPRPGGTPCLRREVAARD